MTTDELIRKMRGIKHDAQEKCAVCQSEDDIPDCVSCIEKLMREAADRLEELDERVAIMQEAMDAEWGNRPG